MNKKQAFEMFGLKQTNHVWSWSAISEDGKTVATTVWADQVDRTSDASLFVDTFDLPYNQRNELWKDANGNRERIEHLAHAIRELDGLVRVLLVHSKDPDAYPREVKSNAVEPITDRYFRVVALDENTGEFKLAHCHEVGGHERSENTVTLNIENSSQELSQGLLSERYDWALSYASRIHRAQTRKGTQIPYISHLMSVSALVLENGGTENQAIAALLHDAAEDQGGEARLKEIEGLFGQEIAQIVADCTDAWTEPKPEWRKRKEDYLSKLPEKPKLSLLVSLADKTHNAESIAYDKAEVGDEVFERFSAGKSGTIWYYKELGRIFTETMPGKLSARLSKAVGMF